MMVLLLLSLSSIFFFVWVGLGWVGPWIREGNGCVLTLLFHVELIFFMN